MESWNRLIAVGGQDDGRKWWKEEEGTNQRTQMNDAWTRTTERGLTVG